MILVSVKNLIDLITLIRIDKHNVSILYNIINSLKMSKSEKEQLLSLVDRSVEEKRKTNDGVNELSKSDGFMADHNAMVKDLEKRREEEKKEQDEFIDKLRAEADLIGHKFGDKIYPKEVLAIYSRVLNYNWHRGDPEPFIDKIIVEWVRGIPHKEIYSMMVENVLRENEDIRRLLILRMNYALAVGEQRVASEITINRKQVGTLTFRDQIMIDSEGNEIYVGSKQSSGDYSFEELDKMADEFYKEKETIYTKESGLPKNVLENIKKTLMKSGDLRNTGLDDLYTKLNRTMRSNMEGNIVARLAFILFVNFSKEINNQWRLSSEDTEYIG